MSLGVMHLSCFSSLIVVLNEPENQHDKVKKKRLQLNFEVTSISYESKELSYNLEEEEMEV